jgi:low affinity Fe/Cu permease
MLVLFLIQNTQNREMTAAQLKLDELIRSLQGAHNVFLNLEDLAEEDLERIRERYSELALRARQRAQLDTRILEHRRWRSSYLRVSSDGLKIATLAFVGQCGE